MIGAPTLHDENGERSLRFADGMVQSRMLHADPTRLLVEYTRRMMGFLLFQPAPASIAMIGLGGGSLARYCAQRLPDADFTAVEISPQVVALRDAFALPPDGERFRVVEGDGAAFVERPGTFDVLLVDGFDASGQPEPLCSAAFYAACRARLAPGGVLVVNLHTDDTAYAARLGRLGRAFGGNVVSVRADGSENAVVFAGTGAPWPPPFRDLVARLRALGPSHPVDLDGTVRKLVA